MLARADGIRGCPTNLVKNNGSKGDDVNYAPCDNPGTQYQGKYAIEMAGESRRVGKRSNLLLQGAPCGQTANCDDLQDYTGPSYTQAPRLKNLDTKLYYALSGLISGESTATVDGTTYSRTTADPSTLRDRADITILGSSPESVPEPAYTFNRSLRELVFLPPQFADILSVAFNKAGKTSGTFGFGSKDTPFTLYMHPAQSTEGGARRKSKTPKNKAPKWVSTGRRAALKDGSKRVVFQNNSGTGELRYKKYVVRAGKRVATYVKFK
jgi:hypothetical protein